MAAVPLTLAELKIQIGKSVLTHSMKLVFGLDERIQAVIDRAPDYRHIGAAERWRGAYPEVVAKVGSIAERALREMEGGRDNAMTSIMMGMMRADAEMPDMGRAGVDIHLLPFLRDVFNGSDDDACKCLEALAAYGRGE